MGAEGKGNVCCGGSIGKWESWIGLQPVLILTDPKALEWWTTEVVDPISGPIGRRFRWHEYFSRFNLHIVYVKGADNGVADALSRYAYPAGQAYRDVSRHGSVEDLEDVRRLKREEEEEENDLADHEFWLEGAGLHPSAIHLPGDGPETFVRPVDKPTGTPVGGPLRFEFKVPKIPRPGQHVRAGAVPRRKSPPA